MEDGVRVSMPPALKIDIATMRRRLDQLPATPLTRHLPNLEHLIHALAGSTIGYITLERIDQGENTSGSTVRLIIDGEEIAYCRHGAENSMVWRKHNIWLQLNIMTSLQATYRYVNAAAAQELEDAAAAARLDFYERLHLVAKVSAKYIN